MGSPASCCRCNYPSPVIGRKEVQLFGFVTPSFLTAAAGLVASLVAIGCAELVVRAVPPGTVREPFGGKSVIDWTVEASIPVEIRRKFKEVL